MFNAPRLDWTVPLKAGIAPSAFPSGFSRVPVHLVKEGKPAGTVDLMAGFFAVGQSSSDKALYPVIGWSAVIADSTGEEWDELAKRFPNQPANTDAHASEVMQSGLELNHFRGRYSSIDLTLPKRNWRIVPSFSLLDADGLPWECFAYDRDALSLHESGRVLALVKEKEFPTRGSKFIQRVYVCELRPRYDPEKEKPWVLKMGGPAMERLQNLNRPITITKSRRLEGDLFRFLFALIDREGELLPE